MESDIVERGRPEAYRWGVLTLFVGLQVVTSLVILSFGPLAVFLQEDLKVSRTQIGTFTSLVYAGSAVTQAFTGWLIDKYGVRRFIMLGTGIIGLFFLTLTRTSSFQAASVLLLLGGIGYAFMNPCSAKALSDWFTTETRATAMGVKQAGVNLGSAVGAAVLPTLSLVLGWRTALALFAIAVIVMGAIGTSLYRSPPRVACTRAPVPGLREFRTILTNRGIWVVGGLGMAYSAIQVCLSTYLVLFLKETALVSVVLAGTCLTVASLSGGAGRILLGVISDRVFGGRRKGVLAIMGAITGAVAVALALVASSAPLWLLYVMVAIFGFTALGWNGVQIAFLAELAGLEQAGTAVGFGLAITCLGAVVGPPIFGYILDMTHSYSLAWTIFAAIVVIGGILVTLIPEQK